MRLLSVNIQNESHKNAPAETVVPTMPVVQNLLLQNAKAAADYTADRRGFLRFGLFSVAVLGFWLPSLAQAAVPATARAIRIANQHTGEKFAGEYWYDGKYIPEAFNEIKKLMRDHRNNEVFPIDPRLMDVVYVIQNRLRVENPISVVSGYRSPQTNAMLRRVSEGVARNSLHMSGQAVDMRVQGLPLKSLRNAAIELHSGGVGYYPSSNFVHIDTGRVRTW